MTSQPRIAHVRQGELELSESWVYAWVERTERLVVYVGSTSLNPELRSWLHLHDSDPRVGRILARRPAAKEEDFDVLAFPVPSLLSRSITKRVLIERLFESGQLSSHYVGEPPEVGEVSQGISDLVEGILDFIAHY